MYKHASSVEVKSMGTKPNINVLYKEATFFVVVKTPSCPHKADPSHI
jgi:hypothetical protein